MQFNQIQNTYLRIGEVQSLVQQAALGGELAQRGLASQLQREARAQAARVNGMSKGRGLETGDSLDQRPSGAPRAARHGRIDLMA